MTSLLTSLIEIAAAQAPGDGETFLTVSGFGFGDREFGDIVNNVLFVLQGAIVVVCTCIFIVGGLVFAISGGNEDKKSRGKDLMFGSLIGMGIVLAAKGIMNMVYFFVYGA